MNFENVLVPFQITSLLSYMYTGKCVLVGSCMGKTVTEVADFDECENSEYVRRFTYNQVEDFLASKGIDIAHRYIRRENKHHFLVFLTKDNTTKELSELRLVDNNKYDGYGKIFIRCINFVKNGL